MDNYNKYYSMVSEMRLIKTINAYLNLCVYKILFTLM